MRAVAQCHEPCVGARGALTSWPGQDGRSGLGALNLAFGRAQEAALFVRSKRNAPPPYFSVMRSLPPWTLGPQRGPVHGSRVKQALPFAALPFLVPAACPRAPDLSTPCCPPSHHVCRAFSKRRSFFARRGAFCLPTCTFPVLHGEMHAPLRAPQVLHHVPPTPVRPPSMGCDAPSNSLARTRALASPLAISVASARRAPGVHARHKHCGASLSSTLACLASGFGMPLARPASSYLCPCAKRATARPRCSGTRAR